MPKQPPMFIMPPDPDKIGRMIDYTVDAAGELAFMRTFGVESATAEHDGFDLNRLRALAAGIAVPAVLLWAAMEGLSEITPGTPAKFDEMHEAGIHEVLHRIAAVLFHDAYPARTKENWDRRMENLTRLRTTTADAVPARMQALDDRFDHILGEGR